MFAHSVADISHVLCLLLIFKLCYEFLCFLVSRMFVLHIIVIYTSSMERFFSSLKCFKWIYFFKYYYLFQNVQGTFKSIQSHYVCNGMFS